MGKRNHKKKDNSGMGRVEKAIRNKTATFKIVPENDYQLRLLVCGHLVGVFCSYANALAAAVSVAEFPENYNFPE